MWLDSQWIRGGIPDWKAWEGAIPYLTPAWATRADTMVTSANTMGHECQYYGSRVPILRVTSGNTTGHECQYNGSRVPIQRVTSANTMDHDCQYYECLVMCQCQTRGRPWPSSPEAARAPWRAPAQTRGWSSRSACSRCSHGPPAGNGENEG